MAKKKSVEDLDFKFSNGELELDGFEEGDEFEDPFEEEEEEEGAEGDEEEEEEEEAEEEEEEIEEKATRSTAADKRIDRLEGLVEKLLLAVATGDKVAKGKADEDEEDEEDEIPDELDNKTMVKLLSKRIDKSIDKRLNQEMSKHTPALEQANINAQFQTLAAEYGQKFVDNIPAVAKVMLKGDIRDARKAWGILQTMPGFGKGSKKVSAEKTVQKLRRKQVDADSRDSVGEMRQLHPRTPFKQLKGSDQDVFDRAWNSALVDTARGRRRR